MALGVSGLVVTRSNKGCCCTGVGGDGGRKESRRCRADLEVLYQGNINRVEIRTTVRTKREGRREGGRDEQLRS